MQAQRSGDILIVDNDEAAANRVASILRELGHNVETATSAAAAHFRMSRAVFEVVVCAYMLPDRRGDQFCEVIKKDYNLGSPCVALLLDLARESQQSGALLAQHFSLEVRASDPYQPDDIIVLPLSPEMLAGRFLTLLRMKRYLEETKNAIGALMETAEGVEEQDERTVGHCKRLAMMSIELGIVLGCDEWDLTALERAGYLHDIGMVTIHGALAHKTGVFSVAEMEILKTHTVNGEALCRSVAALRPVLPIIRSHHERGDGSGYPDRLRADQIPRLVQIFAIPHLYEGMRLARPHRSAMTEGQAIITMQDEAHNGAWNTTYLKAFVEHVVPGLDERMRSLDMAWPD